MAFLIVILSRNISDNLTAWHSLGEKQMNRHIKQNSYTSFWDLEGMADWYPKLWFEGWEKVSVRAFLHVGKLWLWRGEDWSHMRHWCETASVPPLSFSLSVKGLTLQFGFVTKFRVTHFHSSPIYFLDLNNKKGDTRRFWHPIANSCHHVFLFLSEVRESLDLLF